MQTVIRINDSELNAVFQAYVERRLRFALSRFEGRVGQISVRINSDGRRGYRCRVSAEGLPFGRVVAEETGPDLLIAVDQATGRIGRLFRRELGRAREARVSRESIRLAA